MNLNFREFLKTLAGMDRAEIIQTASRERRAAKDFSVGRGSSLAYKRQQQIEYISDLGNFLHFVRNTDLDVPYPDAYLTSDDYKNTLRARNFGL
jgi:hypothetical protein